MTGSIAVLVLAAAAFVASHLVLASPPTRDAVAGRTGERAFLGLYSLLSIVLLVWMIMAFGAAPHVALWQPGPVLGRLPLIVMPVVFVLLVAGYATPNPTAVMGEAALTSGAPPQGVIKITRHPVMWAIALWAAVHVVANGDFASLVFFGALLVLAVAGMAAIDAKKRAKLGADWERFAAATSAIPFVAIIQGRARLAFADIGWARIAAGLALYALFLAVHGWLFGVPPYPL